MRDGERHAKGDGGALRAGRVRSTAATVLGKNGEDAPVRERGSCVGGRRDVLSECPQPPHCGRRDVRSCGTLARTRRDRGCDLGGNDLAGEQRERDRLGGGLRGRRLAGLRRDRRTRPAEAHDGAVVRVLERLHVRAQVRGPCQIAERHRLLAGNRDLHQHGARAGDSAPRRWRGSGEGRAYGHGRAREHNGTDHDEMLGRELTRRRGRSRPSRATHSLVAQAGKPVRRGRVAIRRRVVAVIRPAANSRSSI